MQMKQLIKVLAVVLWMPMAWASVGNVHLDKVSVDIRDQASLQRGVKLFTNYCLGCHSMKYSRYERIANDAGIPNEVYEKNLIFGDDKIGSLMTIAMDSKDSKTWFGATPPDLTLVARLRGADWLYSYLRGFYKDESRPWGVNNVVFKDVGMPHVLVELQGLCAKPPHIGAVTEIDPLSGQVKGKSGCEEFAMKGSMTPEEYDAAMRDLVNFLVYVGEPARLQAEAIAPWVLGFLVILFIFAYLLNKEYWKDVH